jgi:hypothetical protein
VSVNKPKIDGAIAELRGQGSDNLPRVSETWTGIQDFARIIASGAELLDLKNANKIGYSRQITRLASRRWVRPMANRVHV